LDAGKLGVRKTRILVADDDPISAADLSSYLEAAGIEVTVVDNEAGAIAQIKDDAPDLVISSLALIEQSGLELIGTMRRDRLLENLPVVITCSNATAEDRIAALEIGADDSLTRPISRHELVARVRAMLRRTQTANGDLQKDSIATEHISSPEQTPMD
jgi:DNA-binding response OmpR family regulator